MREIRWLFWFWIDVELEGKHSVSSCIQHQHRDKCLELSLLLLFTAMKLLNYSITSLHLQISYSDDKGIQLNWLCFLHEYILLVSEYLHSFKVHVAFILYSFILSVNGYCTVRMAKRNENRYTVSIFKLARPYLQFFEQNEWGNWSNVILRWHLSFSSKSCMPAGKAKRTIKRGMLLILFIWIVCFFVYFLLLVVFQMCEFSEYL